MHKLLTGLAGLAMLASTPAFAQQSAYKDGALWTAARIAVEDGQMENYMDYLAKTWSGTQDYAKSQGWLLDYHILQSVNPRDGEPNIILITRFSDMPTAAEAERRNAIINQRMSQDDHSAATASGQRLTMRKVQGSILYREQIKR
jgi:hypothetical protein